MSASFVLHAAAVHPYPCATTTRDFGFRLGREANPFERCPLTVSVT
jgi:hypothetical protein